MVTPGKASALLIISPKSGSMTPTTIERLRKAFPGYLVLDFDPKADFRERITPHARVIVAGGDGTVGFVARQLVDSRHVLGIISLGTYNNFARGLGLPTRLGAAIRVAREGVPHRITIGRVNGTPFLEAAAVGLFGAAIELGEVVKDRAFGELGKKLALVTGAKQFKYEITGDLRAHGTALSLVFANTPSIGAALPVAVGTPTDPYLELAIHAGATRRDLVGRLLAGTVLSDRDHPLEMGFRFRKISIVTKPRAEVFADNRAAGRTPAEISAELGALTILLPARRPRKKASRPAS